MTHSQSKLCGECEGTGRTSNHVTGEVECGACEGTGREAPSQSTDELVKRLEALDRIYEMHLVAASSENWRQHCELWRKEAHDYAATIERLQRERKEVLTLGRECELSITGDPYEESAVTTHEIAMQAIREALRLGLERNNEANALRTELAARDKTIEALEVDVRWIHQKLKRGEATQDHGLKGNLRCIIDHLADDRPLG